MKKRCTFCKKKIDFRTKVCPYCYEQQHFFKYVFITVLIVFILCFLIGIIIGMGN